MAARQRALPARLWGLRKTPRPAGSPSWRMPLGCATTAPWPASAALLPLTSGAAAPAPPPPPPLAAVRRAAAAAACCQRPLLCGHHPRRLGAVGRARPRQARRWPAPPSCCRRLAARRVALRSRMCASCRCKRGARAKLPAGGGGLGVFRAVRDTSPCSPALDRPQIGARRLQELTIRSRAGRRPTAPWAPGPSRAPPPPPVDRRLAAGPGPAAPLPTSWPITVCGVAHLPFCSPCS